MQAVRHRLSGHDSEEEFLMNLKLLALLIGCLLLLAYSVSSVLTTTEQKPFPNLPAGQYLGRIEPNLIDSQEAITFFSMQLSDSGEQPEVKIFNAGWDGVAEGAVSYFKDSPLLLKGQNFLLRLSEGSCADRSARGLADYCGAVTNLDTGQQGKWFLALSSKGTASSVAQKISRDRSLTFVAEAQLQAAKKELDSLQVESERLLTASKDVDGIRQKSEFRYASQQGKISQLKEQIDQDEKALSALQASFDIARSTTPKGRVTSLSRKLMTKEFDLIDLKLRSSLLEENNNLLKEAAQAREALKLKAELEGEGQ